MNSPPNNTLRLILAAVCVALAAALPSAATDIGQALGVAPGLTSGITTLAVAVLGSVATGLGLSADNARTRELHAALEAQKKDGA